MYKQAPDQIVFLFDIITERKRAEEALRASERLLEESPHGSRTWELGVESPGYRAHLVGGERTEFGAFLPQTFVPSFEAFLSLVHPDDVARMQEWTRACVAGENPADLEFRAIHSDGTFRILKGRGVLVLCDEEWPIPMTGTIQDSLSASGWKRKRPSLKPSSTKPRRWNR